MQEQMRALYERLQGDEQLLKILADNPPFWNLDGERNARNSIIPNDKIYDGIRTPFITVQSATDDLVGTNAMDAIFYIRCYNDGDKTFVSINRVLSRVKALLHGHLFNQFADKRVSINTVYEGSLAELRDEAYDLNFRESSYRISYL